MYVLFAQIISKQYMLHIKRQALNKSYYIQLASNGVCSIPARHIQFQISLFLIVSCSIITYVVVCFNVYFYIGYCFVVVVLHIYTLRYFA